jgi:hypothetical protein
MLKNALQIVVLVASITKQQKMSTHFSKSKIAFGIGRYTFPDQIPFSIIENHMTQKSCKISKDYQVCCKLLKFAVCLSV